MGFMNRTIFIITIIVIMCSNSTCMCNKRRSGKLIKTKKITKKVLTVITIISAIHYTFTQKKNDDYGKTWMQKKHKKQFFIISKKYSKLPQPPKSYLAKKKNRIDNIQVKHFGHESLL